MEEEPRCHHHPDRPATHVAHDSRGQVLGHTCAECASDPDLLAQASQLGATLAPL